MFRQRKAKKAASNKEKLYDSICAPHTSSSKANSFRTKHEVEASVLQKKVNTFNFNVEVGNDSHGHERDVLTVNTKKAAERVLISPARFQRSTPMITGEKRRRQGKKQKPQAAAKKKNKKVAVEDENTKPATTTTSKGSLYPRSDPLPRNKYSLMSFMMPLSIKSCTMPNLSLVKSCGSVYSDSESDDSDDDDDLQDCENMLSPKNENYNNNFTMPSLPKYKILCSMNMGQYGANCAVPRINFDLEKQKAPKPWRMYIDGDQHTGRKYYSNGLVTTYDRPRDFVEPKEGVWREFQDWKSGHTYYSNGVITTWTKPVNTDVYIEKKTGFRYLISKDSLNDKNEC